jgi:hypothetical protein
MSELAGTIAQYFPWFLLIVLTAYAVAMSMMHFGILLSGAEDRPHGLTFLTWAGITAMVVMTIVFVTHPEMLKFKEAETPPDRSQRVVQFKIQGTTADQIPVNWDLNTWFTVDPSMSDEAWDNHAATIRSALNAYTERWLSVHSYASLPDARLDSVLVDRSAIDIYNMMSKEVNREINDTFLAENPNLTAIHTGEMLKRFQARGTGAVPADLREAIKAAEASWTGHAYIIKTGGKFN